MESSPFLTEGVENTVENLFHYSLRVDMKLFF